MLPDVVQRYVLPGPLPAARPAVDGVAQPGEVAIPVDTPLPRPRPELPAVECSVVVAQQLLTPPPAPAPLRFNQLVLDPGNIKIKKI